MADYHITKLIEKKRDGGRLTAEEIATFTQSIVKPVGIDRCQIGAMLMAMYLKGLDEEETDNLVRYMKESGYTFSWPVQWRHLVVDKHSTGGVGDKVSLVLAPVLAALGLKVPMMSGRSLAHTGGTLDKLESIPGFRVILSEKEIINQIQSVGCCIFGQNEVCVPADRVLYHCREITGTVANPSLIVASIVSKKLSEGVGSLIYDVKFGRGSIFKSRQEAYATAKRLINQSKGVNASALLTSMECPLGRTIGNSLEVLEAVECLQGKGPQDLLQLVSALGSELLHSAKGQPKSDAKEDIHLAINVGSALQKFHDMIISQGVTKDDATTLCYRKASDALPKAAHITEVYYGGEAGYVSEIDPIVLANFWKEEDNCSNHHPGVGLVIVKTVGEKLSKGDVWLKVYHQRDVLSENQISNLMKALSTTEQKSPKALEKKIYTMEEAKFVFDNYIPVD